MSSSTRQAVFLITGAGGISSATATLAAKRGVAVFIVGLDEDQCDALCSTLRCDGATCEYAVADLTQEAPVEAAVKQAHERFGRIDALFNSAGISGRRFGDGPTHDCSLSGWRTTLSANVESAFLMSRAVLPIMLGQEPDRFGQRGSILNMSSVLAESPRADHFATHAYAASKGAINSLSVAMAATYAGQRIRVNAIAPGLVRTPMSHRAQSDPTILELLKTKQPLTGEFISPEQIADAALFLLGPESSAITGITMTVDAGWTVSG